MRCNLRWAPEDTRLRSAVLATVLVVAGCSSETTGDKDQQTEQATVTSSQATASISGQLSCATAIGTEVEIPDDYASILDVVALPTAESAPRALQVGQPERPGLNYFAKTGLVIRSGKALTLRVEHPPEDALIGWGVGDPGSALSTEGCDGGDGWIAFAGGLWVREPMCVELTVTADGKEESARVGAGAACGGQQPPPGSG